MPFVAAAGVSVATAFGASAAVAAVVGAAFVGAAVGAVVGAGVAVVTGGDILEGALTGAAMGAVSGGLGEVLSPAATAATAAGETAATTGAEAAAAGAADAGMSATELAAWGGATTTTPPASLLSSAPQAATTIGSAAKDVVGQVAKTATAEPSSWLDKSIDFINKNPKIADIAAQGVGGSAKGLLASRAAEKKAKWDQEQELLRDQRNQITGLENLDLTQTGFTAQEVPVEPGNTRNFRPLNKWRFDQNGLLQKG